MKNVIITVGTGMMGWEVLKLCLSSSEVGTVTSISRRSTGIRNPMPAEAVAHACREFKRAQAGGPYKSFPASAFTAC